MPRRRKPGVKKRSYKQKPEVRRKKAAQLKAWRAKHKMAYRVYMKEWRLRKGTGGRDGT